MQTRVYKASLTLPVTKLLPENPLPRFRDPVDRPLVDGGLLPEEREGFAKDTGVRILPYRMQDYYAAATETQTIPTAVLENDRLRATFLPGYGGRLYSLWDKQNDRECLYCNSAIIIRNLALRNAWFSGGVEWNFGHFGHTFFTCQDVFFAACTDAQGVPFLRMYEYERCKQVTFQVDFHLPPDADALTAHLRIENRLDEEAPIFLWTNTAVPQEPGMHVYSGTDEVVSQYLDPAPSKNYFAHTQLPHLGLAGVDATDPSALPYSCEYFFQNPPTLAAAFEAARYADGRLFAERSTANMPYRKMFCWGNHAGGRHWQRFLAGEGSGDYLEVQAGLARTQIHPSAIAANSVLSITQQFTMSDLDAPQGDYAQARRAVQAAVERLLPIAALEAMHQRCEALSAKRADAILHAGYGWGALEKRREERALPPHLDFPESTLTEEQAPWLSLLAGREMGACASFMVAKPWLSLLEQAAHKDAAAWNQLGIACLEQGRQAEAEAAWRQSLRMSATPLAHRNLAVLAWRQGKHDEAIARMQDALRMLADAEALRPYAVEFLNLLTEAKRFADAFAYYRSLPEVLQGGERMRIAVAKSAFEQGEEEFLKALFATRFTAVKEGETMLCDVWFQREARDRARKLGVPYTEELLLEVQKTVALPEHLDFRMASFLQSDG